jgi:hypothetical protein
MGEPVGAERPQDYGDLTRLLAKVQALAVHEPERQAYRDQVVARLTRVARSPWLIRGGGRAPDEWAAGTP